MKKQTILAATLIFLTGTLIAQPVSWKPEQPKVGETITISYDPSGSPLAGERKIEAVAYCMNRSNSAAKEMHMVKTAGVYTGSFVTDTNTLIVAFSFSAGENKDLNKSKGYFLLVRDVKGQVQPGSYNEIAQQYAGYGRYLYGLDEQQDLSAVYQQKEWDEFPSGHGKYYTGYFAALSFKDKKGSEPKMLVIMNDMISAGNFSEQQYKDFARFYHRLKQKDKAESLSKEMKEKFPDGQWKREEQLNPFYTEQNDPLKKESFLDAYLAAYPPKTEIEKNALNYYYSILASLFAEVKDTTKRDFVKFKQYAEKLPMADKASLYNNISWNLAQKDMELPFCKEISAIATKWAKKERLAPTAKQPLMSTCKKWEADRENTYAMYADTYGFIMYKVKGYKEGFSYVKDAAVTIKKKLDPEYNDRYALLLEKVSTPAEVKKELEPLVKDGKAGKEVKAVLKRTLLKTMGSEQKASDHMAVLNKASEEKAREELTKKLLNADAPDFKLKNMDGAEVNLASLRGKVVVVDFWATWCGPCKASFPGMQKALEKYKANENVVFLFIDTWESQPTPEQRKKEVTGFISQNKYSFNVLYDETRKDDPDKYAVVSDYKVSGIPTKFIIGKDGRMKFQSVGFSGSDDKLVEEISAMVEMAGQ